MSIETFPYTAAESEEEEEITSPARFKGRQGRANVKSAVSRVCFESAAAEDGGSRRRQSEDRPRTKRSPKRLSVRGLLSHTPFQATQKTPWRGGNQESSQPQHQASLS
jgi:hypothetical protein